MRAQTEKLIKVLTQHILSEDVEKDIIVMIKKYGVPVEQTAEVTKKKVGRPKKVQP